MAENGNGANVKAPQRRGLMKGAGIGAAMLAMGGFGLSRRAQAQAITDTDILNFALNLEYLEAEFYLRAAFGTTLPEADITGVGTLGAVSGGSKVPFTNPVIQQYANEIARDERNHVVFLRSVLGDLAVARPAIDLDTSFTNLAIAAGIITPGETFSPFRDDYSFLVGAYIFEDVGVTAYLGAAPLISSSAYLSAAASILAVEAYHAGLIRTELLNGSVVGPTLKISALRAALSGAPDDFGIVKETVANIVDCDSNSLAFSRSTTQVLNIVYGGGAANSYLFFPDKLNGAIS